MGISRPTCSTHDFQLLAQNYCKFGQLLYCTRSYMNDEEYTDNYDNQSYDSELSFEFLQFPRTKIGFTSAFIPLT
jgi:hypothetical protein